MDQNIPHQPPLIDNLVGAGKMRKNVLVLGVLDIYLYDRCKFCIGANSFNRVALLTTGDNCPNPFFGEELSVVEGAHITKKYFPDSFFGWNY